MKKHNQCVVKQLQLLLLGQNVSVEQKYNKYDVCIHTMQARLITRCIKKHDQCVAKHLQLLLLLLLLLLVDGIVIVVAVAIC